MTDQQYDAVIVGGGPGGLSAAFMTALRGMRVVVLDGGSFGGLLMNLYPEKIVLNYPGFSGGMVAKEIAESLVRQAKELGVEFRNERVINVTTEKVVKTEEGEYSGKVVIIATGSRPKEIGILGEMEFNLQDRGVYYFVTEVEGFREKRVVIAGGGDTAIDAALELEDVASSVVLVHRRDSFRALGTNVDAVLNSDKIQVALETQIQEIKGDDIVKTVVLKDREGSISEIGVDAIILAFGLVPNNEIFADLGLELDYEGKIIVDATQKTNLDGFYAVGDIVAGTGSLELIVVAVAQGAIASHHAYLETTGFL